MTTRKKGNALSALNKIRKAPLTFNRLLQSSRLTEEMSQVDLAQRCGTTKAKICDYEKGRRVPTFELAAKLAKALGHSEALFVSKVIEDQLRLAKLDLKIKVEAA